MIDLREYGRICHLRRRGHIRNAIAKELGIKRRPLRKYLARGEALLMDLRKME